MVCNCIILNYNRTDLNTIVVSTEPSNRITNVEGVFSVKNKNYSNTRIFIQNIQSENGENKQEIYTYSVSDSNNNTIGVLQYNFNYIQSDNTDITSLDKLEGYISFANGIFKKYNHAKVYQKFDNIDTHLPRTIYIYY
jgi:hypothetical protein